MVKRKDMIGDNRKIVVRVFYLVMLGACFLHIAGCRRPRGEPPESSREAPATQPARISASKRDTMIRGLMQDLASRDASICISAIIALSGIEPPDFSTTTQPADPSTTTQPAKAVKRALGDNLLVMTAKIDAGPKGLVILDPDTGKLVTYRLDPNTRRLVRIASDNIGGGAPPGKVANGILGGGMLMTTAKQGDGTEAIVVLDESKGRLAAYGIDAAARRLKLIAARNIKITKGIAVRRPDLRTTLWCKALVMVSDALDDDNPSIREHAAWALGRIGRRAALCEVDILRATEDRDPFVRDAAMRAIGRIDARREWLDHAKPPSTPRRRDVRQYVIALKSESPHERLDAALGLVYRAGKPLLAVDALTAALSDESGENAYRAAVALAEIGPPATAARSALSAATKHEDRFVRRAASLALETVASSSSELSPKHRKRLDDILVDRKISLAIIRLRSEDSVVRVLAGRELARHGTRAVRILQEALKGGDEESIAEVVSVLARIGKPATATLIKLLRDKETIVPAFAAAALVDIGRPAVPGLIAALKDPDTVVRLLAAETLGRIGPEAAQAADALTESTRDDNADVRKEAAAALRKIRRKGG